jgi:mRNA-degrading endonuclease RelE of RelBE toxin-antitoxin system
VNLPWDIAWTPTARRDLERLPVQMQHRVVAALERYAATGHGNLDRIEGAANEGRLRVGDWRARFQGRIERRQDEAGAEIEVRVVEVLVVRHRSVVYRD